MNNKYRFEQIIIKIVLISGVILSLVQFFFNRSLWLDEAIRALGISSRGFTGLLKPLDDNQIAPILFLQIEKLFSVIIPNSEFGFRLFPLISYLLSLFLFYKIVKIVFKNLYVIIFSLSLFVFNTTIIYYSSEAKQCMTDVLVLTSVFYLVLKNYSNQKNKYFWLGIIGVISIFLSNISPIVLLAVGVYLLYEYFKVEKKYFSYLTIISLAWVGVFSLYYFLFIYNHPSISSQIINYSSDGFLPTDPFSIKFYEFLFLKWTMITRSFFKLGKIGGIGLSVLILTGIISLFKEKKFDIIILTILPLITHLVLSSIKLYPFETRLILYTGPCIIIISSFGLKYIADRLFAFLKTEKARLFTLFIPLTLISILFYNGFPQKNEEIKKTIQYLQQHINKNDKIYIYYSAGSAFLYYKKIQFIKFNVPVTFGSKNRSDKAKYINELKELKGRNWLLFSHVYENEEDFIIRQLDSLGYKKLDSFKTYGSSTYLYDFMDINPIESIK